MWGNEKSVYNSRAGGLKQARKQIYTSYSRHSTASSMTPDARWLREGMGAAGLVHGRRGSKLGVDSKWEG